MALKEKTVQKIRELIQEIRKENDIKNEIIRDDIFTILQLKCIVLYYPLDDEKIDGFHVEKIINGQIEQFVYINTANTREKQVFVAAHELGHIWKVDEKIKLALPDEEIDNEEVINRFAAEILMPTELFKEVIGSKLKEWKYEGPKINKIQLVKLVVYLMNYFFVPYTAIIYRFNEIGRLDKKYNKNILELKEGKVLEEIIKEGQYTRLNCINKFRSIDNLQQYLVEIEDKKLFSERKIDNIRKGFGIQQKIEASKDDVAF